jgi:hypothetical protein
LTYVQRIRTYGLLPCNINHNSSSIYFSCPTLCTNLTSNSFVESKVSSHVVVKLDGFKQPTRGSCVQFLFTNINWFKLLNWNPNLWSHEDSNNGKHSFSFNLISWDSQYLFYECSHCWQIFLFYCHHVKAHWHVFTSTK